MSECTCFHTPEEQWTSHYGAVDPATQFEPNPDCRVHFTQPTASELEALRLYGPPPVGDEDPHANQAVPDPGETSGPPIFATQEVLDSLPHGTVILDKDHDHWTKVVGGHWKTYPGGPIMRSKTLATVWSPFTIVSTPKEVQ